MCRPHLLPALLLLTCLAIPCQAGEVSFHSDVMAVLSKAGCNQGTCHGNANGKGGLKLSLRGDDPDRDYEVLTRTQFGRWVAPSNPGQSLMLLKPTMEIAHEGGKRFDPESQEYQLLKSWIAHGAKHDRQALPRFEKLIVTPDKALLVPQSVAQNTSTGETERLWTQQIRVIAELTDGSRRDVTSLAVYEPSQPTVDISHDGLVTSRSRGEVTIGVRLGGLVGQQQAVRLAFIEDVPLDEASCPQPVNEIDRLVFSRLKQLRIPASPVCDDTVFLRRAYLDLLGLLPTSQQAQEFISSTAPDKRSRLIDELLERPEFAENWALKWADLLRAEETTLDRKGVENLYAWLRHQISVNRPLDDMCRDLVSGRGSTYSNPSSNYYRAMRDPVTRAESTAQLMLGVRLQCARCHNHPFDRWKQDDYYGWANLFARIDYKILENGRRDSNNKHEFIGEQIVYMTEGGGVEDPRIGKPVPPLMLDSPTPVQKGHDPLTDLADWMTAPDNPFFARVQVNRTWYHLMGRGIVDPIDDFRLTNSPSNPELLDWLADDFVQHGFDMQRTIRLIADSTVYQLSAETLPGNSFDDGNFSHGSIRRLTAEQLLDNMARITQAPLQFNGYPPDVRAGQIPGVQAVRVRDQSPASADKFLVLFGKPKRLQACECERSSEATLAQTFQMISGGLMNDMLTRRGNRLDRLMNSGTSPSEIVRELYWAALSRPPSDYELQSFLDRQQPGREAYEDLLWGLLNSNEFLLRP